MDVRDRPFGCPRRLLPLLFGGVPLLVISPPARAMDAALDYRDARQNARTQTRTFQTYWRREMLSIRQALDIAQPLVFDTRFVVLREIAGGDASGTSEASMTRTYQPQSTLSYRTRRLQAGLRGDWLQRHTEGTTTLPPDTNRLQGAGWLDARPLPGTQLSAGINAATTKDEESGSVTRKRSDRTSFLRAQQALGQQWHFEYGLTGTSSDLGADESHRSLLSNMLELRGSPTFDGDRLRLQVRARSLFLDQEFQVGPSGGPSAYRAPLAGDVVLDDTPQILDPLERDPVPEPALFDRDRVAPTSINLGDSAPPVREFGGDYRNIAYDFGDAETFVAAFLYVDERLLHPELYQWRIFVTDDPDGRSWQELSSDRVTVRYTEPGALLQGWHFTFAEGVSGRFFKMVDVKLGPTVPNLFVTELEVVVRTAAAQKQSENSQDHRLEASVGYDLTPALGVGYETRLRTRRFPAEGGDLHEVDHGIRSTWSVSSLLVSGRFDLREISGSTQHNTDIRSYQLSAARESSERLGANLSWNRTEDRSGNRDQSTDTYALATDWRALPGLRVSQRLSHGRRRDEVLATRASSITVFHRIESVPLQNLTFNINRSDRWVDREAGTGFQRFSETTLEGAWSPVPLITATSDLRYQENDQREWTTRQTLSWSPFPGGALQPTLSGDNFYDSRYHSWQPGANLSAKWILGRGLLAEGGVGIHRFELVDERVTPVDLQVHLSWTL